MTLAIHPFDTIKVNCHVAGEGKYLPKVRLLEIGRDLVSKGGFRHLYVGWDSALLRSVLYTVSRAGIYVSLNANAAKKDRYGTVSIFQRMGHAAVAGGIGALLASPFDLICTRS